MNALFQDLRFGLRMLAKNPGFTAVAVVTLALGIGANTAIFSVTNAALLRYLPVPDPQELVVLRTTGFPDGAWETGNPSRTFSEHVFESLREDHRVFLDLMGYVPLGIGRVAVRYGEEPEEAWVDMVCGNFFSGLRMQPARGQFFSPADEARHGQVAVLSYAYWTRRFARNPSVLGGTLFIKGVPFTLVGVTAKDFFGVEEGRPTDIWVPFQNRPDLKPGGMPAESGDSMYGSPKWWFLMMIGRLRPGVSQEQALAQMNPSFERAAYFGLGKPNPKERPPQLYFTPTGGIENLRKNFDNPFAVLMLMVGVVLVIACVNVAMLVVARNAAREREFGLRLVFGAGRGRLFRQLLTESLLLVTAGGALGWLFALWASAALAAWAKLEISVAPDHTVLLFSLAISILAALAFGLAPLRSALRVPVGMALKASTGTAGQDRRRSRARQAVVALQVSLCLALLVGAGLLTRTLWNLETTRLGLEASGLLVFGVTPPQTAHSDAEVVRFYQGLLDKLRVLPGVESATLTGNRLGTGWSNNELPIVDGANPPAKINHLMRWNTVGPDYFQVLKVPILAGRDFTDADSAAAPKVAVVNRTFADRLLAGRSPVGHQLTLPLGSAQFQYAIVGMAADSKYIGVREEPIPTAYFPYTQVPGAGTMHVELRTRGNPLTLLPEARRAIHEFGPDLPLLEPMTQQEQFEQSFSDERLFARLAMLFGILAALLVATGLYGTLAYRVSRRTAEIGVRMALGAERGDVLWMVLHESLTVSLAGAVVGLPLAIAAGRLLRSMLFGIGPGDPVAFASALAGITAVTLIASYIPARRATKVDPMVALRCE